MRCLLTAFLLPLAGGGLVALAFGAASDLPSTASDRAWLFARDRELIETIVKQGLRLADEDDPLKRADHCNGVARHLADEIGQAAQKRESARVAELGRHLHAVLKRGVASNLTTACSMPVPANSAFDKELQRVQAHTIEVIQPLEDQLRGLIDAEGERDLWDTLQIVTQGRQEVEKIVRVEAKISGR